MRVGLKRIADFERAGFRGEFFGERFGDRFFGDDALGGHADLTGVHEGAEIGGGDGGVHIGIVEDDHRGFAAQFEQDALEVLPCLLGDDAAYFRGAGEIHAARFGIGDEFVDYIGGIGRGVGNDIDHALREARFLENFGDCEVSARGFFRCFEYDRVAVGDRDRDGAHAENHGRVPGRDADNYADCLARGHRNGIGKIGGNYFADEAVGLRGGFAKKSCCEDAIEHAPAEGFAGFFGGDACDLGLMRVENVGRFEQ